MLPEVQLPGNCDQFAQKVPCPVLVRRYLDFPCAPLVSEIRMKEVDEAVPMLSNRTECFLGLMRD
jgi:hypothetical protein